MDLISVIVPVYNVEPYLDRCVESIVNQTYSNLEIILVDDGSPDNCPAMCDAWAERDSRIKVIHKENGGLSDARNAGLDVAEGAYIAFVDSDDWVSGEYIRAMYCALDDNGADIAACDFRKVSDLVQVDVKTYELRVCTPEVAMGELIRGVGFRAVVWNKLYRSTLLDDIRFPVGKHHEDEFFTYRVLADSNKLVYVEAELYFYFQREGSIMHSFSIRRLDALDAFLERLALLKCKYPELYVRDKLKFCFSCVALYRTALQRRPAELNEIKKKIRVCRKQISFGSAEWKHYTMQERVYVLASGLCIGLFAALLNMRSA